MSFANHTKGIYLICLGTVLWGASGVVSQHLFADKAVTAEWLVTFRLIVSGVLLLTADHLTHRQARGVFFIWRTADKIPLIIFGIFGMLGVQYTYFAAIVHSNAATATILQYLMPVAIVFYLLASTRRLPRAIELTSIAVAMAGVFLIVTKSRFDTLVLSAEALFWGISSACFAAFYTLYPRRMIKKWRSSLIIGWAMLIGGAVMSLYQPPWQFSGALDLDCFLSIAAVSILGTALAFCAYLESTKYLSPSEISVFASLEPLSSIILSALFLNVSFGLSELLGAAAIIFSVTVLSLKK